MRKKDLYLAQTLIYALFGPGLTVITTDYWKQLEESNIRLNWLDLNGVDNWQPYQSFGEYVEEFGEENPDWVGEDGGLSIPDKGPLTLKPSEARKVISMLKEIAND